MQQYFYPRLSSIVKKRGAEANDVFFKFYNHEEYPEEPPTRPALFDEDAHVDIHGGRKLRSGKRIALEAPPVIESDQVYLLFRRNQTLLHLWLPVAHLEHWPN